MAATQQVNRGKGCVHRLPRTLGKEEKLDSKLKWNVVQLVSVCRIYVLQRARTDEVMKLEF